MSNPSRRGFTLVELLVVIAIIGTLVGLLIPAVQAARERARQAECNSRVKDVAMAMQNYALNGKQTFPGWADETKVLAPGGGSQTMVVTWAAKLLPSMDLNTTWEQLQSGVFGPNDPPRVDSFMCPSDANTNPTIGTLSYVVNGGMPDPIMPFPLPGSMASDLKANGICHDLRNGRKGPVVRKGTKDITDGESMTLLLAENVQRDPQPGGQLGTWLGPVQAAPFDTSANATNLNPLNPEQRFAFVWVYDSANPLVPSVNMFEPIGRDTRSDAESGANYGKIVGQIGSRFARPASAHPDAFVAAFCDGHTKEISNDIEYRVYQMLMTPNGAKAALARTPDQYNMTGFMQKPLSDSDY